MFDKLQVVDPIKSTILVLIEEGASNISYEETVDNEIYRITNPMLFLEYIVKLLGNINKKSTITIINIFNSFENYLNVLLALYQFDHNRQLIIDEFKHSMKNFNNNSNLDGFDPKLALGQCDLPLSFKLINIIPSKLIGQDSMTVNSILLQQFSRFISLKHGAVLISTSNIEPIMKTPIDFLSRLDLSVSKPIFDSNQEFPLIIPNGWDSFNKIILLGKSSIYQHDLLLKSEKDCNELNNIYNDTFYNNIDQSELLINLIPNYNQRNKAIENPKLMTFNEMLHQVQQPESDIE